LQDALFGYATACTQIYEKLQEPENMAETDEESRAREERCGWFKGESIQLYEDLSFRYPDFAPAWYYLGYAYLNMGLYTKAFLTWKEFLTKADEAKQKDEIEEIKERMEQLEGPMEIEKGCNAIIAGRTGEGIAILEKFKDSKYRTWWPLFFYLGTAYTELGMAQEAIDSYKEVLKLAPSNKDAMVNLAEIYEAVGQDELAEKYRRKAILMDEIN
ncbi:MAG: tetratricopeptide repeat protein, partial [Firmicutes bacterium]|nr:tetratricopeptide repeat protein [Bacillota bacterium]